MSPFGYQRPESVDHALALLAAGRAQPLAGGTNLIDLMKVRAAQPATVLDIRRLPLRDIVATADGGLRLGALASNADTAQHPLVRAQYPLLRAAILAGASPQIRNMASNSGNLLQRTRCHYFYDAEVPCNKRRPGSGCPAREGIARQHAILGASASCVATHPSDLCVALAALQASVHVVSAARGARTIAFDDFHRLPGDRPEQDSTLEADELITHIELPAAGAFDGHATYLKLRERASYAFALVSVAALLAIGADGVIRQARLALGGVAHKPWRDKAAESLLVGRRADTEAFEAAAQQVLRAAVPTGGQQQPETLHGNAFKIPLAQRAIVRALQMAAAGQLTNTGEDAFREQESGDGQ